MARRFISLTLGSLSYGELKDFAQIIHDGLVAQAAIFTTPPMTMLVFQGYIDTLDTCIGAWGIEGDRGSKKDHNNLVAAAGVVKDALRLIAVYVMNTRPNDPDMWQLLGFKLKSLKKPPVNLQKVHTLRNFF